MSEEKDTARAIVDANAYMTLATADEQGVPWASPVWFAHADYRELFWVSDPEARHSRNLTVRPQVSVVIFDSRVPLGTGQAVYIVATAERLTGAEVERGMGIFSRTSLEQGGRAWSADDVQPPARSRLYRATASEHYLGRDDRRTRVSP